MTGNVSRLLGAALGVNLKANDADKDLAEQRKAKKQYQKSKKEAQMAAWCDDLTVPD